MSQLPKIPSHQSVEALLATLDMSVTHRKHIQQYIERLENRVEQLERVLAEVVPELDLDYPAPFDSDDPDIDDQKPVILIVEDDAAINAMIKSIVESEGYVALSAETGQDGIDLANRHSPNLIICDIHLPGMHGLDVIRHFKAIPRLETVPILMLTADLFKAEASFELGADEYITKPIRKNQLMSYVTKYLNA